MKISKEVKKICQELIKISRQLRFTLQRMARTAPAATRSQQDKRTKAFAVLRVCTRGTANAFLKSGPGGD